MRSLSLSIPLFFMLLFVRYKNVMQETYVFCSHEISRRRSVIEKQGRTYYLYRPMVKKRVTRNDDDYERDFFLT